MKKILGLLAVAVLVFAPMASATPLVINLTTPNSALAGYTSPYGTVTIDLTTATTAQVTFVGALNYRFGANGATNLNVNAETFGVSNFVGYTDPGVGSGNISAFGRFNLSIDNSDGWGDSATPMSFLLTNTSGTWASVNDVLVANNAGFFAAGHIFIPNETGSAAAVTGYAADGSGTPVPEPASMLLLGSGLLGAGLFGRRRKK